DEAAVAVIARGQVAIRVVGARSRRTEGQPEADAAPAKAMVPVMGLGLGGARNGDGAEGERSDESGGGLGLPGGGSFEDLCGGRIGRGCSVVARSRREVQTAFARIFCPGSRHPARGSLPEGLSVFAHVLIGEPVSTAPAHALGCRPCIEDCSTGTWKPTWL